MNLEIERKFWVKSFPKELATCSYSIISGYTSKETTSRVNYCFNLEYNYEEGFVTFKGKGSISRKEYEYKIPASEAKEMVNDKSICPFVINKIRYEILFDNLTWEVDEYTDAVSYDGLLIFPKVAEVELSSEDQQIKLPDWVGEEITQFKGFSNHSMAVTKHLPWSNKIK